MAEAGPEGGAAWDLDAAHSGDLLRLERLLEGAAGFSMVFLGYGDASYRDRLIDHLDRRGFAGPRLRVTEDPHLSPILMAVEGLKGGAGPLHLLGLDDWLRIEKDGGGFRRLNYGRERVARVVARPFLIWLRSDMLPELAVQAPDFWSWRSAVFEFVVRPDQVPVPRHLEDGLAWGAEREERLARIAEIDRHLADHPQPTRSTAFLLFDRGRLHQETGTPDAALPSFHEALAIFEATDDERSRAVTLGEIARLKAEKGAVEEALALHGERLEIFERLGDVRSRAVTLGDIARLKAGKGAVEEALALHGEQLEIFERLGDVRERAVTLYDLAGLEFRKPGGPDVEKALAYLEEAFGTFQRLGDVEGIAVVGRGLARLHAMAGRKDEARALLARSLAGFRQMGWEREVHETLALMAALDRDEGAS